MNSDIRIKISFKSHRKRKKLRVMLGPGATDYLIDLWLTVAEDRPDGVLADLDDLDIALMAGWDGDPKEFVSALVVCGFLECINGVRILHDWVEHNPYASSADDRSDSARLVRMAKTHPSIYDELKKQGVTGVTREQYKKLTSVKRPVNETLKVPLTPSPSPIPEPLPKPKAATGITSEGSLEEGKPAVEEVRREPLPPEDEKMGDLPKRMAISEAQELVQTCLGRLQLTGTQVPTIRYMVDNFMPEAIAEAFRAAGSKNITELGWVVARLEGRSRDSPETTGHSSTKGGGYGRHSAGAKTSAGVTQGAKGGAAAGTETGVGFFAGDFPDRSDEWCEPAGDGNVSLPP